MFERSYQCQHPHTSTHNNMYQGYWICVAATKLPIAVDFNDSLEIVSMDISKKVCHFVVANACINGLASGIH